jgi:hypothetical protein
MLTVYLNRGQEPGSWDWSVCETGTDELGDAYEDYLDGLPVPYDSAADEYEVGSVALRDALVAAGYDVSQHWSYIDNDYGLIGEWNRPEAVS